MGGVGLTGLLVVFCNPCKSKNDTVGWVLRLLRSDCYEVCRKKNSYGVTIMDLLFLMSLSFGVKKLRGVSVALW